MPILALSPEVVALIAAGEVVERPASVAKELIENSIDAGATQIDLEVQAGGVGLLRVVDNGCGIDTNELDAAFLRHATSKIVGADDLQSIHTLGFRGEALASIASVADVTLVTRPPNSLGGHAIRVNNGVLAEKGPRAAPAGTSINVRNLFRAIPARLKFLKSNAAEAGRITALVSQFALAYPEIHFSVSVDGRRAFSSPGNGGMREAIAELYGLETAEQMLEGNHSESIGDVPMTVSGMIGSPSVSRANRSYVTLFVNRRLIENRTLVYAVIDAYQGLLLVQRYPVAVLNLTIDPGETDVNVHPAKAQIKFRDEGLAFAAIHRAVKQRLGESPMVRAVQSVPTPALELSAQPNQAPMSAPQNTAPLQRTVPSVSIPNWTAPSREGPAPGAVAQALPANPQGRLDLPALRVLGQLRATFIIAEGPEGMYLIDQHTAHERVLFDQLRQEKAKGQPIAQGLLEPAAIDLLPRQRALLEEHGDALAAWGFVTEPFGEKTVLLRAVPGALRRKAPEKALLDVLDYIDSDDLKGYDWQDRALASVACHGAIRAGQELPLREMQQMGQLLEAPDNPHASPHGRPIVIQMTTAQIEREFARR